MEFVLSSDLLFQVKKEFIEISNIFDGAITKCPKYCLTIFENFNGKFTKQEFIDLLVFKDISVAKADFLFLNLRIGGVITEYKKKIVEENLISKQFEEVYDWSDYGWLMPKLYHYAVSNSKFIQGDDLGIKEQIGAGEAISRDGFGPEMTKSYPNKKFWQFDNHLKEKNINFFDVLIERRTRRKFSVKHEISFSDIESILYYSSKAHRIIRHEHYGDQMFRTSPSGGARHPVEIYPQIFRAHDFESGNYYYDPKEHGLFKLNEIDEQLFYEIGQQQSGCVDGAIGFIITARFPRNLWKYRYPKSYSFTLFDVGHFVQTLILVLQAHGLHSFITPAIDLKKSLKYLDLNNYYDECPMYLIMAGK